MFRGINPLSLDPKGRLTMPTRYRELLMDCCQGKLVITIDQDKCLVIYPQPKWLEIEQQLENAESSDDNLVAIKRLYVGYATEYDMDAQGRILLPQVHRDWAELDKKIVLVGQIYKFEVWQEEAWMQHTKQVIHDKREGRLRLPPDVKVSM